MELSQPLVSLSKTVRPIIPRGARCLGHVEIMWSAVCSLAPHSQFAEKARPHLCMDETKRPTLLHKQLGLTQDVLVELIPMDLVLTLGVQTQRANVLLDYSVSHVKFVNWAARMPNLDNLCNNLRAAGRNGCLDFSLPLLEACDSVSWPCRMWSGCKKTAGSQGECLRELGSCPLEWDIGIQSHYAKRH